MSNPAKNLGHVKCYSSSSPRPVKNHKILPDTIRRSAVDQEDLKPYWKSEKQPHFPK